MNRYILFAYANYYPAGGAMDFAAAYETQEEAQQAFKPNSRWECAHIAYIDNDGSLIVSSHWSIDYSSKELKGSWQRGSWRD